MRAARVSFVDVPVASGGCQVKPSTPFIMGLEFPGEVRPRT
jgi:NADPH:quinone reductase-like Zn-dependent oxidoreductase